MGLILLVLLVLLFVGALPTYGYSREWGYRPSGLAGLLLVVLVILLFLGTVPVWFAHRPVYVVQPRAVYVPGRPVQVVPAGTQEVAP